jgi:hypothetical protein
MRILFDSMGSQVQVQNETGTRLNTLLGAIGSMGYSAGAPWSFSFTDYTRPISQQLDGVDVLVILTHQRAVYPGMPPAIPADVSFSFFDDDLERIPGWVSEGKGLLLVSNHGAFARGEPPFWPVNDAVLAGGFGISIVPAAFMGTGPLSITPAAGAPARIVSGVAQLVANNSCGIAADGATVIAPIPPGATDRSGNGYSPADYAFSLLKPWGDGSVIVAGNSGTAGDRGNRWPSNGKIPDGNNLCFYLNCLAYLGGVSTTMGAGFAGEEAGAAELVADAA